MKQVIFGGQYGSEGKGAVAEWYAKNRPRGNVKLVVAGENSPNSGHTCSEGKTRNIPASSFYADVILLGPDAVINPVALAEDLAAVRKYRGEEVPIYIHENACLMDSSHAELEKMSGVIDRVSSTGSGSGAARVDKYYHRNEDGIVGYHGWQGESKTLEPLLEFVPHIHLVNRNQYLSLIEQWKDYDWLFECSQGVLLDTNWGIYPFVTSRTTLPRVAIARNGLDRLDWQYTGVYRTFPIRTGGHSGPTGGLETTCATIGVPDEFATVTKRMRRIFQFSKADFILSNALTRPDAWFFTHLDYVMNPPLSLAQWMEDKGIALTDYQVNMVMGSVKAGQFKHL